MEFGILQRYPNLRRLSEHISTYMTLCRPFTLLGAFISGFCMDIMFSRLQFGAFSLPHATQLGATLALLQAGGQVMNQSLAEEVEIDRLNGKTYRPTVDGSITLLQAKIASMLLYLAGVMLAFNLSLAYGLFSILIVFFAAGYTMPPLRVKKRFILNNIWQGVARGMLPIIYVALAYPEYMSLALPYGLTLAIWVTSNQTSKDFGDEVGDRAYGIKSLPVTLGPEKTLIFMDTTTIFSFIVLNLFISMQLIPSSFIYINLLLIPSAIILYGLRRGFRLEYAENNLSWVFFYGTLGLWYILPMLLIKKSL